MWPAILPSFSEVKSTIYSVLVAILNRTVRVNSATFLVRSQVFEEKLYKKEHPRAQKQKYASQHLYISVYNSTFYQTYVHCRTQTVLILVPKSDTVLFEKVIIKLGPALVVFSESWKHSGITGFHPTIVPVQSGKMLYLYSFLWPTQNVQQSSRDTRYNRQTVCSCTLPFASTSMILKI